MSKHKARTFYRERRMKIKRNKKLIILLVLMVMSIVGVSGVYAAATAIECPSCHERTYAPNGRKYTATGAKQYECSNCGHKGTADESPDF